MLSGVFGVAVGYVVASGGDRLVSTHALNASGQDAPAQGQIYNSEAISLPIWTSWTRLLVAAGSVALPMVVAANVRSAGWKSFFQLAGFGALARTAGKAADDGMGYLAGQTQNPMLVQLYSPEIAASTAMATSALSAPSAAPAGTFAGFMGKLLGFAPKKTGASYIPATRGEGGTLSCPQGYSLGDDGYCYPNGQPPATPPSPPAPPTTTPTPPSQTCPPCPPSGGGTPTPLPPITTPVQPPAPSGPVPITPAVSSPATAPVPWTGPLMCNPDCREPC